MLSLPDTSGNFRDLRHYSKVSCTKKKFIQTLFTIYLLVRLKVFLMSVKPTFPAPLSQLKAHQLKGGIGHTLPYFHTSVPGESKVPCSSQ